MKGAEQRPERAEPSVGQASSMSTKQTYPTTIVPVISGWIMHT